MIVTIWYSPPKKVRPRAIPGPRLGPSEIYETRFAGVWLITHYNEDSSIIGRFIEITRFPDILKSQQEDMTISLDQLEQELEHRSLSDQTETDAETNT